MFVTYLLIRGNKKKELIVRYDNSCKGVIDQVFVRHAISKHRCIEYVGKSFLLNITSTIRT